MSSNPTSNPSANFLSAVTLQTGSLATLDHCLPALAHYSQIVLLSHPSLMRLHGNSLLAALKRLNRPILELSIPAGERSKSLTQANHCWQEMAAKGIDRQAAIVAFGGGVICDLAGFVASCYMRGLDTFYLPTTLLAMVDAALGGKTGVNLPHAKNVIGTFHLPRHIVIDPICLMSLPPREFNSGLAEIIKYGIISDPLLVDQLEEGLERLEDRQGQLLENIILRCISIKHAIIAADEKDVLGKRAILNYGHTFGHVIEALTGYRRYLHGEAVAMGMSCAVNLSVRLKLCDSSVIERQDYLCQRVHLPTQLPRLSIEQCLTRMKSDKKTVGGKINLILLEKIGKAVKVCDVDPRLIQEVLLAKMG